MSKYNIIYTWKHVEGHMVRQSFTKEKPTDAESEDEAIEIFKNKNQDLGQYIKKDNRGWNYGKRPLFYDFPNLKAELL